MLFMEKKTRPDNIRAVVFDFDGTLAGLEIDFDLMRRRVADLAAGLGLDPSELLSGYLLENLEKMVQKIRAVNAEQALKFEALAHREIERIELEAADRGRLFPETIPALIALRKAGLKLAVITRNFGGAVNRVFPDLTDYCQAFLPREAALRVKPDPAHLEAALELLGVAPDQSLMVGDHPIDIETGRRAGTMTVGVTTGRIGRPELSAAGADRVFDHVGSLTGWLLSENQGSSSSKK